MFDSILACLPEGQTVKQKARKLAKYLMLNCASVFQTANAALYWATLVYLTEMLLKPSKASVCGPGEEDFKEAWNTLTYLIVGLIYLFLLRPVNSLIWQKTPEKYQQTLVNIDEERQKWLGGLLTAGFIGFLGRRFKVARGWQIFFLILASRPVINLLFRLLGKALTQCNVQAYFKSIEKAAKKFDEYVFEPLSSAASSASTYTAFVVTMINVFWDLTHDDDYSGQTKCALAATIIGAMVGFAMPFAELRFSKKPVARWHETADRFGDQYFANVNFVLGTAVCANNSIAESQGAEKYLVPLGLSLGASTAMQLTDTFFRLVMPDMLKHHRQFKCPHPWGESKSKDGINVLYCFYWYVFECLGLTFTWDEAQEIEFSWRAFKRGLMQLEPSGSDTARETDLPYVLMEDSKEDN